MQLPEMCVFGAPKTQNYARFCVCFGSRNLNFCTTFCGVMGGIFVFAFTQTYDPISGVCFWTKKHPQNDVKKHPQNDVRKNTPVLIKSMPFWTPPNGCFFVKKRSVLGGPK